MNFIYETLIMLAVALVLVEFSTITCFRGEHFYIVYKGVEEKHYVLKKSRFLFLPAYLVTRNWKTGIIRKSTLWGLLSFYLYFLCFYIADLVYYIMTESGMLTTQPLIWVIFMVILPVFLPVVIGMPISIILARKENQKAIDSEKAISAVNNNVEERNADGLEEIK